MDTNFLWLAKDQYGIGIQESGAHLCFFEKTTKYAELAFLKLFLSFSRKKNAKAPWIPECIFRHITQDDESCPYQKSFLDLVSWLGQ